AHLEVLDVRQVDAGAADHRDGLAGAVDALCIDGVSVIDLREIGRKQVSGAGIRSRAECSGRRGGILFAQHAARTPSAVGGVFAQRAETDYRVHDTRDGRWNPWCIRWRETLFAVHDIAVDFGGESAVDRLHL